jgi:3-oxoacyl-(acyl-carrier-protein) synthase
MKAIITGIGILDSSQADHAIKSLGSMIRQMRIVHSLERLAVATSGTALKASGLVLPEAGADMGLFIGIDESIEDIKDEFFEGIMADGILGASPLIFPFTSPNAISAQISIAFGIRGESILMPINRSCADMIQYCSDSVLTGHSAAALAGIIRTGNRDVRPENGRYIAKFIVIEREEGAKRREADLLAPLGLDELEDV